MYKIQSYGVLRVEDNAAIPGDPDNYDWKAYLLWLAEGNTPAPEFTDDELAALQLAKDIEAASAWRFTELQLTARQLEAIEEDEADETPADLLPGTRKQWLKYRGQVSNWKEGTESFPDIEHRPVRPS
ncbi:hypothetical protein HKK52_05855 [Pseudomonas sp. ADAK2]|uniref:hypothetical protein n=1 Tax=unclassified Pseudomonas TaxID=196821 RepID=UPI001463086E|nr:MULTISPECIES: hypothetical protein [unclassified Pseudomonas]QJI40461.1 hypothetical protein HKK53_05850 [Pseudomonas sp. ADAK7]QJI46766.1 hypothetical protein HKK52_05855 [Pseudomonas sp. ADAK2]